MRRKISVYFAMLAVGLQLLFVCDLRSQGSGDFTWDYHEPNERQQDLNLEDFQARLKLAFLANGEDEQALVDAIQLSNDRVRPLNAQDSIIREAAIGEVSAAFQKVIDEFPNSDLRDDAQLFIATTIRVTSDGNRTRAAYQKLIDEFPGSTFSAITLASGQFGILVGLGKWWDTSAETDACAQYFIAQTYWDPNAFPDDEDATKAIVEARKTVVDFPNSAFAPAAQFLVGRLSSVLEDKVQARDEFQKVIDHYPDNLYFVGASYERIGALMTDIGEWEIIGQNAEKLAGQFSRDDYFAEARFGLFQHWRWPDPSNLTLFAHGENNSPLTPEDISIVDSTVAIFEKAFGGLVGFQVVSDPAEGQNLFNRVDYEVIFSEENPSPGNPGFAQMVTGDGEPMRTISRVIVRLARGYPYEARLKTAIHEFQHGLGAGGHSHNDGDILFFSTARVLEPRLSSRDINTIRRLYSGPGLRISSRTLTFGQPVAGESEAGTFTLTNFGDVTLSVSEMWLGGVNLSEFSVTPSQVTIPAGESVTVEVVFTPSSSEPKTASLRIEHDASGNPDVILLTGNPAPPSTQDVWRRLGPPLASIGPIAVDPSAGQTVYAGVRNASGGVYKTIDGGASWNAANAGLPNSPVTSLAIDPNAHQTIYVGTLGGVYKTGDGGNSWTSAHEGLSGPITSLAIDPIETRILYAGTADAGVFKSVDGGAKWEPMNVGLADLHIGALGIDPVNPQTLYAGTIRGGVYKSTDSGDSWTAINTGLPSGEILDLVIDPSNPQTIYVGGTHIGVFRSTDGGGSWMSQTEGLFRQDISALAVDPAFPNVVYFGLAGGGVFRSTDGGASWQEYNTGLTNKAISTLAIDPSSPYTLYAGTEFGGGVFSVLPGPRSPRTAPVLVDSLAFGTATIGESSEHTFQITNTGFGPLTVHEITVSGTGAAHFSVSPTAFTIDAEGESREVKVIFSPTSAGEWSALLSIERSPGASPVTISLTGTGKRPEPILTETVAFGIRTIGESSEQIFRISNPGPDPLVVSGMTLSGPDASLFSVSPTSFTIDVEGESRGVTVTFSPTSEGVNSATLSIEHSAAEGPFLITLTGTGTESKIVSTESLAFGTTYIGESSIRRFSLTNPGDSNLPFSLAIDGPDSVQFTVHPQSLIVLPQQNRTVSVTFTPSLSGTRTASVRIVLDAPDNPFRIALTGEGANPPPDGTGLPPGENAWTGNGPAGRRVTDLAIAPSQPSILYAATDSGVFKSSDGGRVWMNRGVGTTGLDTRALTIDPSDPQTVYVGTGGFEGPPRIYKTRDGGTTWASVYEGPSNFSIGSLSIDPVDPQKIYVVVAGNVFTSTDGGNNWFQIYDSQNLVPVRFLTLALANPQVLYAGTDDSPPLMSTDGGQTWTQIQGGLPGPEPGRSYSVSTIAIHPVDLQTVYIGLEFQGLFKSTDGGASWTLNSPVNVDALAIDPNVPDIIYVNTRQGVSRSMDGGMTWESLGDGLPSGIGVTSFAVHRENSQIVYAGTEGSGVFARRFVTLEPAIGLSTSVLEVTQTGSGSRSETVFSVSNTGNARLSILEITVGGADTSQFTVSPTSFTVEPGAQAQTITVTFAPTSPGEKQVVLSIVHNGPDSPSLVRITGIASELEPVTEGPAGPIALDVNSEPGDQGERQKTGLRIGDEVAIDIVALSGTASKTGFQVRLRYDPEQLAWVGFIPTDIFASGVAIPSDPAEGVVEIAVAILGGQASEDSGSLGTATFKVLEGFTGETTIELISAAYDGPVQIGSEGARISTSGSTATEPTTDFDGDGTVGFQDFILFAQNFGNRKGEENYNASFDLDSNGVVGFQDFLVFAQAFGN